VVTCGGARFTVLSDSLIRLEATDRAPSAGRRARQLRRPRDFRGGQPPIPGAQVQRGAPERIGRDDHDGDAAPDVQLADTAACRCRFWRGWGLGLRVHR
jgi:hypothetical protein